MGSTTFFLAPGFSGVLWSWQLELRGSGGQVAVTESQIFGDPLGLGTPAFSAVTRTADEAIDRHLPRGGRPRGARPAERGGDHLRAVITYDTFATISAPG